MTPEQKQGLLNNLRRAEHDIDVLDHATDVNVEVRAGPTHGGLNRFSLTFMSGETLDAIVDAVREKRVQTRDRLRQRCQEEGVKIDE